MNILTSSMLSKKNYKKNFSYHFSELMCDIAQKKLDNFVYFQKSVLMIRFVENSVANCQLWSMYDQNM